VKAKAERLSLYLDQSSTKRLKWRKTGKLNRK